MSEKKKATWKKNKIKVGINCWWLKNKKDIKRKCSQKKVD